MEPNLDVRPITLRDRLEHGQGLPMPNLLQFGLYRGDTFLKFVPNKAHVQLGPIRDSNKVRPHERRKGYGGMVIGDRRPR